MCYRGDRTFFNCAHDPGEFSERSLVFQFTGSYFALDHDFTIGRHKEVD
jgi:hypothetical protein